jgi:GDP-4-dehydro-6-deoxy-D-mannose reductase
VKVLITGVTGMAGSHLAEYCATMPDVEIHGLKRWRADISNITEDMYYKINFHECDLRDQSSVMEVLGKVRPDKIFHLAAQSFVKASWQYPHETFYTNIMGQCNVLEAARQLKLDSIIHLACSSEEYGMVPPEEAPIKETNPLRPLSPYGVSKVAQDLMGWQYFKSYGLRIIRTRAFNHEGPRRGHAFVTSNFALQVARAEKGLTPPIIYVGNLTSKRDYTDVRDMVRAYWLATEKCVPGEVYNVCSGNTYPMQYVLDYLVSQSKVPLKVEVDPARLRPSDVQLLWGDNSKFVAATGWKPEIPLEKTLSDTLDFWRDRLTNGVMLRNI